MFAAVLTQDFGKCVGVEILSGLYSRASSIAKRFDESFREYLSYGARHAVRVHLDSLERFDWADGDVVFANSTCFDDDLMQALSDRAERLKPGAFVITFTKGMNCRPRTFELLERKRYKMSWGPATVFIHRRYCTPWPVQHIRMTD